MRRIGIGLDLGGTQIKGAAFDLAEGKMLEQRSAPTRDGECAGAEPAFIVEARGLVQGLEEQVGSQSELVGVCSPGFANRGGTCIVSMPGRLKGLEGLEWPAALDRPAAVLNDAHAALMGEIWQGAAAGLRDVIMLTLGTGVGGAIVTDGRLLRGHTGKGGHLGHASLDMDGAPDICGIPGALEDMIGNHNIGERSGGRFATTLEMVEAVREGDEQAREIWERSLKALAVAIASYVNILDPSRVLIGGGISQAWDLIEPALISAMDKYEWRPSGEQVEIRRAALGEWAGAYGAVYYAMRNKPS